MKKFCLFPVLFAFCMVLSGAEVFVLKPVKFRYAGVVEVLKKGLDSEKIVIIIDGSSTLKL